MTIKKRTGIIIFSIAATISSIYSQEQRPRIGLVLSGGGAKGLAHIGILKAIDSAGLKIDYVAGTSMGAIIGAMYSAGYSGNEIEQISKNTDWMNVIKGSVNFQTIGIQDKEEFENNSIVIPFVGSKPHFGTGIIESQEIMLTLSKIFYPVYKSKNFNEFDIPFRCIATDLSTGNAIVFDKGEITTAIRSSMAIPGVFSAMKYGNTKLVDGGIVRNFPVKDVQEMGADYVIGVNLFSGLANADELTSFVDVFYQITNYRDAEDLVHEKSVCDMIIEPDVRKYSASSFDESDSITMIGDRAGEDFYLLFKQLADSIRNNFGVECSGKSRLPQYNEKVNIESFAYSDLNETSLNMLKHNLNLKEGQEYSVDELNNAFRKAYSSQYYKNLYYTLIPTDSTNKVRLNCIVEEEPLTLIKLAASHNSFTNSSLYLTYTRKNILGERSETTIKMALSEYFRLKAKHHTFVGKKYNKYIFAECTFDKFDFYTYDEGREQCIYENNIVNLHLGINKLIGNNFEVGIKTGFEGNKFSPKISPVAYNYKGKVTTPSVHVSCHYNSMNRKLLPTSGLEIKALSYCGYKRKYDIETLALDSTKYTDIEFDSRKPIIKTIFRLKSCRELTSKASLITTLSAGHMWNHSAIDRFMIGGTHSFFDSHFSFYGYKEGMRYANSAAIARLQYQHKIISDLYGIVTVNGGLIDYMDDKITRNNIVLGGGLTIAYNFSILPFSFTAMYSPDTKDASFTANIGFSF